MAVDLIVFVLFIRLDPIISDVPVQELKLSAVRFAVDSQVILPSEKTSTYRGRTPFHGNRKGRNLSTNYLVIQPKNNTNYNNNLIVYLKFGAIIDVQARELCYLNN